MVDGFAERTITAAKQQRADERAEILRSYGRRGMDIVVGEQVAEFAYIRSLLATTTPEEWRITADWLEALLGQEPLASQSAYSAMRVLIWGFSEELASYAHSAGYTDATT